MTESISKEITQAEEHVQQGQMLVGAGKFAEAIVYFDNALQEDAMNQETYILKGIAKANLELLDEAKECFSRALMINKENSEAYMHMGNIFFMQDEFVEGLKNYNMAISLGYENADLHYHLGIIYEERNEMEMAIRNFNKAIRIDEVNPVYRIRKASVQLLSEKCHEALQTLEELLKVCPDSFDGYHLSAAAYTMLGDFDKAEEVLAFAESLFPEDRDIIFDHIRMLVTKGDLDLAIEKLNKMNETTEDPIEKKEIYLNLGKIFGQKEDLESADNYFQKALQSGENEEIDLETRYLLMNSYLVNGNYQGILEQAEFLEKANHENVYALCGKYYKEYATAQIDNGKNEKGYREAISFYRNISTNEPSRVDAYLFRAMCHKELEEFDRAIELVDYVILVQPENGQLHTVKGNFLKEMGKTSEAEKEYQLAKQIGNAMAQGVMGG